MICADSLNDAGLILALNGADERLQITLGRLAAGTTDAATGDPAEAELLASQEWTVPGQAMRFLAPGIGHMLDALGAKAQDIRAIVCVHGPGSFTGLRMSLALAEGLAAGTGARLAGVGHLELLAYEAAHTAAGAVLALSWSRRGQVYAQAFQSDQALTPPTVVCLTTLPEFLAPLPRPLYVLGGGLRRNLPVFQELALKDVGLRLLPPLWDAPRPQTLLALAARASFGPGPLLPVYLRASDAEDNLAAIAAGRGLSEPEAQAILARGSRTLS
ncbi:MAG: tRNA (adenosine(37)-N6)-threonylcarbamoyltransferase complex dimerization subunit type 1 TsaB [Humidesulfovibrio sp.]|nr:tRNA (adenosine(37)-N6)-threonylcarbamoyltransferase complex dimerization subunit type 1 TsaB [Humidesulfovibrio sp.]